MAEDILYCFHLRDSQSSTLWGENQESYTLRIVKQRRFALKNKKTGRKLYGETEVGQQI